MQGWMDAILERKNTTEEDEIQCSMDVTWHQIQEIKLSVGDNFWFKLLLRVVNIVLIKLHPNDGIEQLYSLMNKNKPKGLPPTI